MKVLSLWHIDERSWQSIVFDSDLGSGFVEILWFLWWKAIAAVDSCKVWEKLSFSTETLRLNVYVLYMHQGGGTLWGGARGGGKGGCRHKNVRSHIITVTVSISHQRSMWVSEKESAADVWLYKTHQAPFHLAACLCTLCQCTCVAHKKSHNQKKIQNFRQPCSNSGSGSIEKREGWSWW